MKIVLPRRWRTLRSFVYPPIIIDLLLTLVLNTPFRAWALEHHHLLEAGNMRTAQNVVSIYDAARAAGSEKLKTVRNIDDIIETLTRGVHGTGTFAGSQFRISPVAPEKASGMRRYLRVRTRKVGLQTKESRHCPPPLSNLRPPMKPPLEIKVPLTIRVLRQAAGNAC